MENHSKMQNKFAISEAEQFRVSNKGITSSCQYTDGSDDRSSAQDIQAKAQTRQSETADRTDKERKSI